MLNPIKFLSKLVKSHNQKQLDKLLTIVEKVNNLEADISKIKDSDFPKKTSDLKDRLKKNENINDILPDVKYLFTPRAEP